jgi:hypothetical protein
VVIAAAAYDGSLSWCEEEDLAMFDNEAVDSYSYGGIDRMRSKIVVSQAAYAEASTDQGLAALSRTIAMLTAHGHSPSKAAEIVRVAQRSWSKEPQLQLTDADELRPVVSLNDPNRNF